jgi:hypothetical protein
MGVHAWRRPSYRLSFEDAKAIWPRLLSGEFINRIAASYDVNPGRIVDIKMGRRFKGSREAAFGDYSHCGGEQLRLPLH